MKKPYFGPLKYFLIFTFMFSFLRLAVLQEEKQKLKEKPNLFFFRGTIEGTS